MRIWKIAALTRVLPHRRAFSPASYWLLVAGLRPKLKTSGAFAATGAYEGVHHRERWGVLPVAPRAAGIAVAQVAVVDLHLHGAVAHPGLQGPGVDGPARLQVGIEAGGGVHLVAAQLALHAELVAVEVLVAATVVAALVVVEADGQVQLARRLAYRLQPAHGATVEVAVEVDHRAIPLATRITLASYLLGYRLILHDTALAHVGVDLQGRLAEVALVVHPGLLVVDALARVVQLGVGGDGARVVLVGVPGLPQRIFSVVLLQAAVDQRQAMA
ncbi:hypothetical protein Z046_31575 [Pseudomonas aeruginosa VRFPA09]|nr:hypothetical protein Z046_31575 [Pseudomonas aeruginosa VRFPA09]